MRILLCLIVMLLGSQQAAAHAMLMGTMPAQDAVIDHSPGHIVLSFMEPVTVLRLSLVSPTSQVTELQTAQAAGNDLMVAVPDGLERGTHLLSWRVFGQDPHTVAGILTFSVQEASETPLVPAHASPGLDGTIWALQLLFSAGIFAGIGGVFFRFWLAVGRPFPAWAGRLIHGAAGTGAVAALALAVLSGLEGLDVSWQALASWPVLLRAGMLTSGLGKALAISLAVVLALAAGRIGGLRTGRLLALTAVILACAAIAMEGHSSSNVPGYVAQAVLFAHAVSLMFWLGSLVPLGALLLTSGSPEPLRRFSTVIPAFLALLVLSGAALAGLHLKSVTDLLATDFGLVLLVKLLFFVLLVSIAAYNRFFLTSRIHGEVSGAGRVLASFIGLEIVLVLAILAVVGVWRFAPPPLPSLLSQPIVAGIEAGEVSAVVRISPGFETSRSLSLALFGGNDSTVITAMSVTATPDNKRAAAIRRGMVRRSAKLWKAEGVYLPVPGRWTFSLEAETAGGGTLNFRREVFVDR